MSSLFSKRNATFIQLLLRAWIPRGDLREDDNPIDGRDQLDNGEDRAGRRL